MAAIHDKEEAFTTYQNLITRYGLKWTAAVPVQAWEKLTEAILWLSIEDRRRAAGLPINPKS
jgi:hypothetical protein